MTKDNLEFDFAALPEGSGVLLKFRFLLYKERLINYDAFLRLVPKLAFSWSIRSFVLLCTTFNFGSFIFTPLALALISFISSALYVSLYWLISNFPLS